MGHIQDAEWYNKPKPIGEQQIKMAAKLYQCRDTARGFLKETYSETLKPYIELIKTVMATNKIDELKALIEIGKTNVYKDSGITQILFMAAAVEMIEPSN